MQRMMGGEGRGTYGVGGGNEERRKGERQLKEEEEKRSEKGWAGVRKEMGR